MLRISQKITYFMLSNRSGVTVLRGFVELSIGFLLLFKPLWARHFLFYLPLAVLGSIGIVGAVESLVLKDKASRLACGIAAALLLAGCAALYFGVGPSRLPVYAVAVWAVLDGIGFIRGCFVGEKFFLSRMLMLAAGVMSACFGVILFGFSTRGFWWGCELLGVFFLSLGLLTLTVSPLIWHNDR